MQVESTKFVKSSIILRSISRKNAVKLVELYHYSHAIPANCSLFLGVYFNSILSGCICFGESVGRRMKEIVSGTKRDEYLELVRLALSPKMPKNSESTFFNTLAPAGRMLACANTAKAARQYVKPKPIDRVAAEKQKTTNLNELRRSIKLT